jgi:hypothetical protein
MRFTLTIDCDGAAFDGQVDDEVARILIDVADTLQYNGIRDGESYSLRDLNGNRVGTAAFSETEA